MKKLFCILFFLLCTYEAASIPLREEATFHDWSVFITTNEHLPNTCYALSTPYRTRALSLLRNLPFLIIKHVEGNNFTLSATSGFLLNPNYGMIIQIGRRSHRLVGGSNEFTWTSSYLQDRSILEDMLSGQEYLKVRSFSRNNDSVLDYYSLIGLSEALTYMEHNCNL